MPSPHSRTPRRPLARLLAPCFLLVGSACGARRVPVVSADSPVVIYGTPWCGGARQAAAYFDAHAVPYQLRDVDHDDRALQEMERAATRAGLPVGQCPLLDIGGHVVLGFDRQRVQRILDGRE